MLRVRVLPNSTLVVLEGEELRDGQELMMSRRSALDLAAEGFVELLDESDLRVTVLAHGRRQKRGPRQRRATFLSCAPTGHIPGRDAARWSAPSCLGRS